MIRYLRLLTLLLLSLLLFTTSCSKSDTVDTPKVPEEPKDPDDPDKGYEDKPIVGKKDLQLAIISATVSESNIGEGIERAFDGDRSTVYHSYYRGSQNQNTFPNKPVVMEFVLAEGVDVLDYVLLYPRSSGENGIIIEGELYVKSGQMTDYPAEATYIIDFGGASTAVQILDMPKRIEAPKSVKLVVTKGQNDYVSLAEIEFYEKISDNDYSAYYKYFTDLSCSELVAGNTREELLKIDQPFFRTLALKLYDKNYPLEQRVLECKTYPFPAKYREKAVMSFEYGIYDNATGIYAQAGEHMTIFVDETIGAMNLVIVNPMENYSAKQSVPLRKGINLFRATSKGLMYLVYANNNEHKAKVHIATGTINGLYDKSRHKPEQWQEMIGKATYTHFDMLGDKAHVLFTVNDLKNVDGPAMLDVYDEIVQLGQDFTGMTKYGHIPPSRLCYIASNEASHMHTTTYRTAYNPNTIPNISNPGLLKSRYLWGPVHETGHVHQVTPGMKWGRGYSDAANIIEVTNNLNCLHLQTLWKQNSRMEMQYDYEHAYKAFFIDNRSFREELDQKVYGSLTSDMRLISFWQLQLYFGYALKNDDFYADLHEATRNTEYPTFILGSLETIYCMEMFAYNASKVSRSDLTDFFDDYGYRLSADAKNKIKGLGFSEPSVELRYITDSNKHMYGSGASGVVKGGDAEFKKIVGGYTMTISGWQNVVAYEVYNDSGELVYVSPNELFSFLSESTKFTVKAVGADKSRTNAGEFNAG